MADFCLVKRAFDDRFAGLGFVAPAVVFERRRRWRMRADSSVIDIVFGAEDGREWLEYSLATKLHGYSRGRIYTDGTLEELDAQQEVIVFEPSTPGNEQAAEQRFMLHNERVEGELRAAGFVDGVDHSLIRDALPIAAGLLLPEWHLMLDGTRREHRFCDALRRALELEVGRLVETEKRIDLGERWPNLPPRRLGGVDLLVRYMPDGEYWRYLAELKWSAQGQHKVYESLWDAVKMLAGSEILYVEAAYLLTAATVQEWERPAECGELFTDGEWEIADLISRNRPGWRFLVQESGPPPVRLPSRLRTTAVTELRVNDSLIKVAAIEPCDRFGERLVFEDGHPHHIE
jgi:hypothetical protein